MHIFRPVVAKVVKALGCRVGFKPQHYQAATDGHCCFMIINFDYKRVPIILDLHVFLSMRET